MPILVHSRRFAEVALLVLPAVFLPACPGTIENRERFLDAAGTRCTEPLDVPVAVFKRDCNNAICHDSEQPAGGLDLDSPGVVQRLVSVPGTDCGGRLRIDPDDPDRSLLLEKLESISPECGDRMPLGSPLPANVIACVRQWVHVVARSAGDAGAKPADASADSSLRDAPGGSGEP